jgi:TetR/AcrR family transcriptional regulator of autoinduction and epiphytic fitness
MGRKEDIIESIISASLDEFMEKGVDRASMEGIAKRAEVSKRTLYKYFSNKDFIYDHIINILLESLSHFKLIPFSEEQEVEKQLDHIIDKKVEHITNPSYLKISRLVLSELLKGREIKPEHMQKFMESEMKFFAWLEDGKKLGILKEDIPAEVMAKQFHALIKGQIFYPTLFGFEELTDEGIELARASSKQFFINSFVRK